MEEVFVKKILVSDYDDTLFIDEEGIKENIKLLKKWMRKKNIVVIATGRSYYDMMKEIKKYKIPYHFLILNHGATILDRDDEILYSEAISKNTKEQLRKDLELSSAKFYFCCCHLESRVSPYANNLTKIHIEYATKEQALEKIELIRKYYSGRVRAFYLHDGIIEVVSDGCSKCLGVTWLLEYLNVDDYKMYVIGNGYTDIDMVRNYHGYCMKSAVEPLKEVATKEYDKVSTLLKEVMEQK